MLAGKVKDYKGPKTHHAIIKQIRKDLSGNIQHSTSFEYIERVIKLFFSRTGIGYYFYHKRNVYIKGLGYFKMANKVYASGAYKRRMLKKRHYKLINNYHKRKALEAKEKAKNDVSL